MNNFKEMLNESMKVNLFEDEEISIPDVENEEDITQEVPEVKDELVEELVKENAEIEEIDPEEFKKGLEIEIAKHFDNVNGDLNIIAKIVLTNIKTAPVEKSYYDALANMEFELQSDGEEEEQVEQPIDDEEGTEEDNQEVEPADEPTEPTDEPTEEPVEDGEAEEEEEKLPTEGEEPKEEEPKKDTNESKLTEAVVLSTESADIHQATTFEDAAKLSQGTRWIFGDENAGDLPQKVFNDYAKIGYKFYFIVPKTGDEKFALQVRSNGAKRIYDINDNEVKLSQIEKFFSPEEKAKFDSIVSGK